MYRHTQTGWLIIAILGVVLLYILLVAFALGWHPIAMVVFLVLAVVLALFYSLTVEIRQGLLECRFGVGLIRRQIQLSEIRDARAVRNRWWYGWGIRLTPHGWLWNVSGLDAVELDLTGERRFRIGTDRPEELAAAVRDAIGKAS
jgi:hypothetical protein